MTRREWGAALRAARERDLGPGSRENAARIVGASAWTIAKWETGRPAPRGPLLDRLLLLWPELGPPPPAPPGSAPEPAPPRRAPEPAPDPGEAPDVESWSRTLREERRRLGSARALAERIGVSEPEVRRWERGEHLPQRRFWAALGRALPTCPRPPRRAS